MNTSDSSTSYEIHTIESVVQLTQVTRHQILIYCRRGLLQTQGDPEQEGWTFDDEAIHQLRRLESLRARYKLDVEGLELVHSLLRDVERLQEEVRFLRRG